MKVTTMRGKTLDMGELAAKNEKAIALGNAKMNARGDLIGLKGNIVKRREVMTQEYYAANPKAVKQVALRDISKEVFVSPAEAVAAQRAEHAPQPTPTPPRKRKIEDRED